MTTYWADTAITTSGDLDVGGRVLFYGHMWPSCRDYTAFGGGGQANATQLDRMVCWVTTVAAPADSVKLYAVPIHSNPGICGPRTIVINLGANACDIYPGAGCQIDALGANNPYSLAAGGKREFWPSSATQWYSFA